MTGSEGSGFEAHAIGFVASPRREAIDDDWGEARPNRLGLATCALLDVGETTLRVRGLDAIDGTPVLDIKPYMTEFGPRGSVSQPAWSHELMAGYY
jgi:hypothetical protein